MTPVIEVAGVTSCDRNGHQWPVPWIWRADSRIKTSNDDSAVPYAKDATVNYQLQLVISAEAAVTLRRGLCVGAHPVA